MTIMYRITARRGRGGVKVPLGRMAYSPAALERILVDFYQRGGRLDAIRIEPVANLGTFDPAIAKALITAGGDDS